MGRRQRTVKLARRFVARAAEGALRSSVKTRCTLAPPLFARSVCAGLALAACANEHHASQGDRDAGSMTADPGDAHAQAVPDARVDSSRGRGDATDMGCAWADAKPLRLPANVWLVANLADLLEMNAPDTPWKRTHAVLTEPGNIIEPLQSTIRFGAVFHGGQYDQPMCPTLRRLEPAVGNFAALRDLFPATPPVGNDSEAAYALESIRDWQMSSDPSQASNTVVLVRGFTSEIVCEADAPPEIGRAHV